MGKPGINLNSTNTPFNNHSKMEVLLILIFIYSHLIVSDTSYAVDLRCPEIFQNGENIVTCSINTTAVREADCLSVSESVTFDRTIGSQTTAVCTCKYDPNQQCIPLTQNGAGSCWCSKSERDIFTYSFSYLANSKLDQGGQLECKICILPEKSFNLKVFESCRNMRFVSAEQKKELNTIDSTPNSSVAKGHTIETAGKDPNSDGSDHPTNSVKPEEIIGGTCAAVLIIAIIIIAAVIYFKKFKKRSSRKNDRSSETKSKENEQKTEMLSNTEEPNGLLQKVADDSLL